VTPLRDPLFAAACAAYALNRWVLAPWTSSPFLRNWFNDLLLVPCALPVQLALYAALGLRSAATLPTGREILAHLAFWSILFEGIGPWLTGRGTGDPLDVAAYAAGAAGAHLWWRRAGGRSRP
jgi:hypothetical protein